MKKIGNKAIKLAGTLAIILMMVLTTVSPVQEELEKVEIESSSDDCGCGGLVVMAGRSAGPPDRGNGGGIPLTLCRMLLGSINSLSDRLDYYASAEWYIILCVGGDQTACDILIDLYGDSGLLPYGPNHVCPNYEDCPEFHDRVLEEGGTLDILNEIQEQIAQQLHDVLEEYNANGCSRATYQRFDQLIWSLETYYRQQTISI